MLHRAYEKNNIKLIKLLIEKGASINDTDKYDNTILHKACKKNNVELVKFLIEKVFQREKLNVLKIVIKI